MPQLPRGCGVYHMYDAHAFLMYIGKAKNLSRRVSSYQRVNVLPHRLQVMVQRITRVDIIETPTEHEALLLEAALIQKHRPPYNILLKEGQPLGYIALSEGPWPRLFIHRGRAGGAHKRMWGPIMSQKKLKLMVAALQRIFQLRVCSDAVMNQRKKPCLLHHIGRCHAPCVGHVGALTYQAQVKGATHLLQGQGNGVLKDMTEAMYAHSKNHYYEQAAQVRDRIQALHQVRQTQLVYTPFLAQGDVIMLQILGTNILGKIWSFQNHHLHALREHTFPWTYKEPLEDIMYRFLQDYYGTTFPSRLIVNVWPRKAQNIQALGQHCHPSFSLERPQKGKMFQLLQRMKGMPENPSTAWDALKHLLNATDLNTVEVYDNSHLRGTYPWGAMIYVDPQGFQTSCYRTFALHCASGDDYAMMAEVMHRRLNHDLPLPDLMILDGGRGQKSVVEKVFRQHNKVMPLLLAIAKGPGRQGPETLYYGSEVVSPSPEVLYMLQRWRDEAHRYVITTHRRQRSKGMTRQWFQDIPGLGPKGSQALLSCFGTLTRIKQASVQDLQKVPGISLRVAQTIERFFAPFSPL